MRLFKYKGLQLVYEHADHFIELVEVFLLDVYRVSILKKDDNVIDFGAGIGDFSILASKRVGPKGKIIALEPIVENFKLLLANVQRNGCSNITPINTGVSEEPGQKEISFWGRKYTIRTDTLENIIAREKIASKINFIKMDIEGFETEVVRKSLAVIREANAISIELHRTKEMIDELLRPYGFVFHRLKRRRLWWKVLRHVFTHPYILLLASYITARAYPTLIFRGIRETTLKNRLTTGVYIRS